MATNILALPEGALGLTASFATAQDSDWLDAFAWTFQQSDENGTRTAPLDIAGIASPAPLRNAAGRPPMTVSTVGETIINGGATGTLALNVLAAQMASLPSDTYTAHLHASADGHLRVVGHLTVVHEAAA